MLRFLTSGESHGPALTGILEGMPRGVAVAPQDFVRLMRLRWQGYGRGGRRTIETDDVEVLSGVRHGHTLGTPIALLIRNRDFASWEAVMSPFEDPPAGYEPVVCPRPGHADLVGALKFGAEDLRDIIDRASARETAMRVALSVIPRAFLRELQVESLAFVTRIGNISADLPDTDFSRLRSAVAANDSGFLTPAIGVVESWRALIDSARASGDTLGGSIQILIKGLPAGLGSFTHWDHRLDGRLTRVLMSIPAVRAVEIGEGIAMSGHMGSQTRDNIAFQAGRGFSRTTNFNGGCEGGMTSGEILSLRVFMKPLPTVRFGETINIATKQTIPASIERSDTVALPALALAAESVVVLELASAFLEKFGGETLDEIKTRVDQYVERIRGE